LNRLFPKQLADGYQGSALALWLLIPVLLVKTLMGVNFSGLNPLASVADILQSVDGVALDTFSEDARAAVIESAAAWGVALLVLCVAVWLFVLRYRAGIPLGILLLLAEQVARTGMSSVQHVVRIAAGAETLSLAAAINLVMTGLLAIALLLSLLRIPRSKRQAG